MYEVTVTSQVANIRGGRGTSNVLIGATHQHREILLTFSPRPTYLEELPEEVKADAGRTLMVRQVPADEWKRLKAQGAKPIDLAALRRQHAMSTSPARTRPGSGSEPDSAALEALMGISNIGKGTATKLLDAGITRERLEAGDVHPESLRALLGGMQPAQEAAVLGATTPEMREQLKAERIQEPS